LAIFFEKRELQLKRGLLRSKERETEKKSEDEKRHHALNERWQNLWRPQKDFSRREKISLNNTRGKEPTSPRGLVAFLRGSHSQGGKAYCK